MIKRILFVLLCQLLALNMYAQDLNQYNYGLGMKAYSLNKMPKLLNEVSSQEYKPLYANTVFVKVMDNQINYRVIGSYYSEQINFTNQCSTCQEGNGKRIDYAFMLGFERNMSYSKIQPYYGVDFGYRANNFSGSIKDKTSNGALYTVESNKAGATLSPFLGVKLNLSPNILVFGEGNLAFYYSYESRETVDVAPGSPTSFNRFTRMEYLLNPISAGIQINFGSKN